MESLGEQIREKRESKKMTLEQLSQKTKISVAVLEDIENGRFDLYRGDELYVKMYIKKIAEALDIEEVDEMTQQYTELTREIELKELEEKEELLKAQEKVKESNKISLKKPKVSLSKPQIFKRKSVYEDRSYVNYIRMAIIFVLVCLVIAVVWVGIRKTRNTVDDPNFNPPDNPQVDGEVIGGDDNKDDDSQTDSKPNTQEGDIKFTRDETSTKKDIKYSFTLPENTEEFTFKIEFMNKTWAGLKVNGASYADFKDDIYHNYEGDEPDVVELTFKTEDFENLVLRNGYSMGHRYYINNQLIEFEESDYSEGVSNFTLTLEK